MLEDESVNDGKCWEPRAMTKEDVAAAALYRAKAEEARRNHERREQHDAVSKWIATGDPEAVERCNQWMEEDIEAMRLKDIDPTEDLSDWEAVEAKRYREFWEFLWADSFDSWEDITPILPMCYTDEKPPRGTAYPVRTLQVFRSELQPSKVDWTGLWMSMVSLPHVTRWITIATLSSTALGITAKPLTRRIHV
ncbi:uncharacterized protein [Triticum aestivum]|uniref:uncharacterized protein n=1 Tax=Triticum aestivum TaxID=4565 RepID=UPI001D02A0A3|nr:uncharacterized protein LOC123189426 [Triticum aestivum]